MTENKYIRFDWAVKRMLRDKANFDVLEGLITVLLEEEIKIEEILESEGNQETANDKFNRVDIKARNSKGEIIIVEVQQAREVHYLERILYGVAKSITEHISLGEQYDKVKKVYSISILYFDLGEGTDYLYRGQTIFKGVHTGDTLKITTDERDVIEMKTPDKIFPEYYLIRVKEFNKIATTPLEEWLEYLRYGEIKDDTTAPGLQEARKKLSIMQMTDTERQAYWNHVDNVMSENGMILAAQREGRAEGIMEGMEEGRKEGRKEGIKEGVEKGRKEGIKEGMEKGRKEGIMEGVEKGRKEGIKEGMEKGRKEEKKQIASSMKASGVPFEVIKNCTGLSETDIEDL